MLRIVTSDCYAHKKTSEAVDRLRLLTLKLPADCRDGLRRLQCLDAGDLLERDHLPAVIRGAQ